MTSHDEIENYEQFQNGISLIYQSKNPTMSNSSISLDGTLSSTQFHEPSPHIRNLFSNRFVAPSQQVTHPQDSMSLHTLTENITEITKSSSDQDDDLESITLANHDKENSRVSMGEMLNEHIDQAVLKKIHAELLEIHGKIVGEYKVFQVRQKELLEKELVLKREEEKFYKMLPDECRLDMELKAKYEKEIQELKEELKEKIKENKRLGDSFKTIKQSNESLRQQIQEQKDKIGRLEKQNASMSSRIANLQKIHETGSNKHQQVRVDELSARSSVSLNSSQKSVTTNRSVAATPNLVESLGLSLDWLNNSCLKKTLDLDLPINTKTFIVDKVVKLLPSMAELLSYLNPPPAHITQSTVCLTTSLSPAIAKHYQTFLEFIYWSLIHIDTASQSQRINLTATLRRIGDELYKFLNESRNQELDTNPTTSLLTCLILLRTISQVDHVINVFEWLNSYLTNEENKKVFLDYYGSWCILKWCKLNNTTVLNAAVDIYTLMSRDGQHTERFLVSCSTENFFSNLSVILRNHGTNSPVGGVDVKLLEKLSLLLQKLSTIKSNKKLFESCSLNKLIDNLLQQFHYDNKFLERNLTSCLVNIGSK